MRWALMDLTELMTRSLYWRWWLRTNSTQNLKILNTFDFDKDNFLSQDNGLRNEMDSNQDDLNNFIRELDEEGLISSRNNQ